MRGSTKLSPLGLVAQLAPLATVATIAVVVTLAILLGACAAQRYCETDVQCREGELCERTTNQCLKNPCHGAPTGTFVRCDGDDSVLCDDTGHPAAQSCSALGCDPAVGGCRPCNADSVACHNDALVSCDDQGEVSDVVPCPYGCDASPNTDAFGPVCYDCRPYTVQCQDQDHDLVRCSADGHVVTRESCTHGCNADRDQCNTCEPESLYCDGDGTTLIQCDADGLPAQFQGQPLATDCDHGCNVERAQCNDCSPPDQTSCDGPYRIICSPDGIVAQSDLCLYGCNEQRAQCNECTPGTQSCDTTSEDLLTCTPDGLPGPPVECPLGCNHTAVPSRCNTFTPTALSQSDLSAGTTDLVVTTPITIDTDAQTVNGAPPLSSRIVTQPPASGPAGPDLFVVHYRDISVLPAGFITVIGSRGLALVASGRMDIQGTIDAAATQSIPGPGGRDGFSLPLPTGPTAPPNSDGQSGSGYSGCGPDRTGGGGAGQASPGGNGGHMIDPTNPGGPGGPAIPSALAITSTSPSPTITFPTSLQAGWAGASSPDALHLGGAGGGLLILAAAHEIILSCPPPSPFPTPGQTLCGHIDVSGGGGTAYGAGGGSAGTILIEAPTLQIEGQLHAIGGGGACGAAPLPGIDGAHGGQGCHSPNLNGGGGNGGLADNRLWSTSGGNGTAVFCTDPASAGGGAGSAGRLHLRATPTGLLIAPTATLRTAPCAASPTPQDCFIELVGE